MTTGDVALVAAALTLSVFVIDVAITKTEEPKTEEPKTPQQVEESVRTIYDIKKITLEEHEYWFFSESRRGGGICHSESCRCKKEHKE